MRYRSLAALLALTVLSACAATPKPARPASTGTRLPPAQVITPPRQPVRQPPSSAQVLALPGLESVIGATSADLARRFGPPRLDVWEGDARKLQFLGEACVLDVYLYPAAPGRDPQATYADARRASDGRDVDRAACVAALARR